MNAITTYSRRLIRSLLITLAAACSFVPCMANAEEFTAPEELIGATQGFLEFTVEDYLATSQTEGRFEVTVNEIDPRLRMPRCAEQLTASMSSPGAPLGRVTVRLRCDTAAPWTVFVPAQVKVFRDVVMTTRPLTRDTVLGAPDIVLRERDVGLLTQGYLTSLDQALGMRLTRQTVSDQVLSAVLLEQPELISKGDHVVIIARTGALAVRMPGEALSKGALSQQIPVRNLNSQRVIKARVTGPGEVEVSM
jgi:flagella basal body P-ring formation protein FlgA